MNTLKRCLFCVAVFTSISGSAVSPAVGAGDTARAIVMDAATALGGLSRVQGVKNITLIGYGQYAYQFGAGNVTASPNAAQRFQAANDLRRVYDLENDRFAQTEHRNMLFTFASIPMTSWQPIDLVLDGDIAYDVLADGKSVRAQRWTATPWQVDGVHMRRMWMLNNPVAIVRAALDPGTKLTNARAEHGVHAVDLTLKEGDKLTLATDDRTHLPSWIRWNNPHNNFGELTFTTYLEGYTPTAGLLLPLSYNTKIDWRDIAYLKVYVDGYEVDGSIPNLAASEAVRSAPEPQTLVPNVKATPIAKGIWYVTGGRHGFTGEQGTTVFEFADHLTLFELNNKDAAKAIIDFCNTLVPGKVATQLITSHAHPDHIEGIRVAVAEGLAVISRRENESVIHDMVTHPAPDYPDILSRTPKPLKFMPVDEHLRLSDPTMTVDVYWARTNSHMADGLFAYAPEAKVVAEADIATAASDYQFWADDYKDVIEYYKLDVQTLLPVHFPPMKESEVDAFIKAGVDRARARCAAETEKGNYYIGCPIISHRY